VTIYDFHGTASGGSLPQLWSGPAGSWPNLGGNANLVATVAKGRVYVASFGQLQIFGLTGGTSAGPSTKRRTETHVPRLAPKSQFAGAL
jgi:hypothetical protein